MKAKPSIKVEHDESPSIAGKVLNSTTNIVVGSEGGLINAKNETLAPIGNGHNDEDDEILPKILSREKLKIKMGIPSMNSHNKSTNNKIITSKIN
jgi:hypothetical protein